eukprot:10185602-Lingulodinium_polyedra.AAC.1
MYSCVASCACLHHATPRQHRSKTLNNDARKTTLPQRPTPPNLTYLDFNKPDDWRQTQDKL